MGEEKIEEQTSSSPWVLLSGWVSSLFPLASESDSNTSSSKACRVGMCQATSCGTWQGGLETSVIAVVQP